MKLKPIETGCLAMIIKSRAGNEGKIVRVGKFIGKVLGFGGTRCWECDITLLTSNGTFCNHIREDWVMRIDGEDFSTEDEEILEKESEK